MAGDPRTARQNDLTGSDFTLPQRSHTVPDTVRCNAVWPLPHAVITTKTQRAHGPWTMVRTSYV